MARRREYKIKIVSKTPEQQSAATPVETKEKGPEKKKITLRELSGEVAARRDYILLLRKTIERLDAEYRANPSEQQAALLGRKKQELSARENELSRIEEKFKDSLSSERLLETGSISAWQERFIRESRRLEALERNLGREFQEKHLDDIAPYAETLLALKEETEQEMDLAREQAGELRAVGDGAGADKQDKKFKILTARRTQIQVLLGKFDPKPGFEIRDQKLREALGLVEHGTLAVSTGISPEEANLFQKVEPFRREWEEMQREVKLEVEGLRKEIRRLEGKTGGFGEGADNEKELEALRERLTAAESYQREIRTLDNAINEKVIDFLNRCREKGVNFKQAMQQLEHFESERRKQKQKEEPKPEGAESASSGFDWEEKRDRVRQYLELKPRLEVVRQQIEDNKNAFDDVGELVAAVSKEPPAEFDPEAVELTENVAKISLASSVAAPKERIVTAAMFRPVRKVRKAKMESGRSDASKIVWSTPVNKKSPLLQERVFASLVEEFDRLQAPLKTETARLAEKLYGLKNILREVALPLYPEAFLEKLILTRMTVDYAARQLADFQSRKADIVKEISKRIGKPIEEQKEEKAEREKPQIRKKSKEKKKEKEQKHRQRLTPQDIYGAREKRLVDRLNSLRQELSRLSATEKILFGPGAAKYEEEIAERLKQVHAGLAPAEVPAPEAAGKFYETRNEFLSNLRAKQAEYAGQIAAAEEELKNAQEKLFALQTGTATDPAALRFYKKLEHAGVSLDELLIAESFGVEYPELVRKENELITRGAEDGEKPSQIVFSQEPSEQEEIVKAVAEQIGREKVLNNLAIQEKIVTDILNDIIAAENKILPYAKQAWNLVAHDKEVPSDDSVKIRELTALLKELAQEGKSEKLFQEARDAGVDVLKELQRISELDAEYEEAVDYEIRLKKELKKYERTEKIAIPAEHLVESAPASSSHEALVAKFRPVKRQRRRES